MATRCLATYPFELSGGLRQRAMIAMALVCHPALLIADEPFSGIDASQIKHILRYLMRIKYKNRISILMISHDINLIREISHRVLLIYDGVIVEIFVNFFTFLCSA